MYLGYICIVKIADNECHLDLTSQISSCSLDRKTVYLIQKTTIEKRQVIWSIICENNVLAHVNTSQCYKDLKMRSNP